MDEVAQKLHDASRFEGALRCFTLVLTAKKKALGTREHADVAATLGNMAIVLRALGRHEEALRRHEEALTIMERVYGSREHADVAAIRDVLQSLDADDA